jgi:hypothetical protein
MTTLRSGLKWLGGATIACILQIFGASTAHADSLDAAFYPPETMQFYRQPAKEVPGSAMNRLLHLLELSPSIAGVVTVLIALKLAIPRKRPKFIGWPVSKVTRA